MKILAILLIFTSFSVFAYEDEKEQATCTRISGGKSLSDPNVIRCETKREVCYIYSSYGISCHIKKDQ